MKLFIWLITVLAMAQSCLFGSDDQYTRRSLVGLSSVAVVIEDLRAAATEVGLTEEAIRTDVELKLRLAGMRIDPAASEYLYVNVNVVTFGRAAGIEVELDQPVKLARNPSSMSLSAATWSIGSVLTTPTAQAIRDRVKDQVDMFLNAWLSVNPKK
jgi:hypothetical protein